MQDKFIEIIGQIEYHKKLEWVYVLLYILGDSFICPIIFLKNLYALFLALLSPW